MTPTRLRAARKALAMSQRQFAPKLDVSIRTMRRMETGEAPIRRGTWKLVEELLAADPDQEQEQQEGRTM